MTKIRSQPYLFYYLLLSLLLTHVANSLKCFSGDPAFRNECTSLSYCLFIISRTGRTQWTCDGNAMNQVSLCSTLGLQQDIAEEAANFPTYVDRTRDHAYRAGQTDKLVRTPYESTAISSNRFFPSRSLTGAGSQESVFGPSRRFGASPLLSGLRCFNGGELGRICCCSSDYCNSADGDYSQNLLWMLSSTLLFLLWRQ